MTINYNRLQIGDRLVRTKNGIFSKHHALYAGYNFNTNQHLVAENQVGYGVRVITLNQFLREGTLTRVDYNDLSERGQQKVISRIKARLGKAYNLASYNCEHFVNEVLKGKASSQQVAVGVTLSLFALAWLFSPSS